MDAEEELLNLSSTVSFPEAITSNTEVINLMPTSSDTHPPESIPDISPINGLGGIPPISQAQGFSRPLNISGPTISLGFNSDTPQSAFSFGRLDTATSQPIAIVSQPRWPPEIVKQYDDATKRTRFVPTLTPKLSLLLELGWMRFTETLERSVDPQNLAV